MCLSIESNVIKHFKEYKPIILNSSISNLYTLNDFVRIEPINDKPNKFHNKKEYKTIKISENKVDQHYVPKIYLNNQLPEEEYMLRKKAQQFVTKINHKRNEFQKKINLRKIIVNEKIRKELEYKRLCSMINERNKKLEKKLEILERMDLLEEKKRDRLLIFYKLKEIENKARLISKFYKNQAINKNENNNTSSIYNNNNNDLISVSNDVISITNKRKQDPRKIVKGNPLNQFNSRILRNVCGFPNRRKASLLGKNKLTKDDNESIKYNNDNISYSPSSFINQNIAFNSTKSNLDNEIRDPYNLKGNYGEDFLNSPWKNIYNSDSPKKIDYSCMSESNKMNFFTKRNSDINNIKKIE